MSDFLIRDATLDDKTQVLAFTAHTWESGDYIQWVYDDWVADQAGRFLVAVDRSNGRIAAIDKLSMRPPDEVWFEGLRVNPDYRGRGLSGMLQRHMIEESRRLGARVVRFLTLVNNLPVHSIAFRDGFSMRFVVRHWDLSLQDAGEEGAEPLRSASPGEATQLFEWWRRSSAYQATDGLEHRGWSYGSTSPLEWEAVAEQGLLLVPADVDLTNMTLPPPLALVRENRDSPGEVAWSPSTLLAPGGGWATLARGLIATARGRGVGRIRGLLPDTALICSGFRAAGFTPDPDDECLVLFRLDLA